MSNQTLPHTFRMLQLHRYFIIVATAVIFIGPSLSALRIGNAPVAGVIVAFIVAALFFTLFYRININVQKKVIQGEQSAWISCVFLSLNMAIFIVGLFALRELFAAEVRTHFFTKPTSS